MKRALLFAVFLIALIGGKASPAWAGTVAVLPTEYIDSNSGLPDKTAASEFHSALLGGVKEAGFEGITGERISAVVYQYAAGGDCDRDCMTLVQHDLGVSEVVQVRVVEDASMASRTVTVTFAARDSIVETRAGGYEVVKTWMSGAVALSLKEEIAQADIAITDDVNTEQSPENSPKDSPEQATDDSTKGKEGITSIEVTRNKPYKKLGPAPLIFAASATLAFGVTTLILDTVTHRKFESLEQDVDDEKLTDAAFKMEQNKIDDLQLLTKIFLGATAVSLVTTGVLAIFTDFTKSKLENARIAPTFAVGRNSGAVFIGGRF